ncbi:hypothetical protein SAMN05216574_1362 [Blastococcus tunisiensis]|uniref:Uncharacterized protein n=2 Tax=Blastococcus tunisiensis TaxID=1798228 RepID=A0A1I2MU23_9ACTN|nr:hypothetical protein SAMN05216574_1362 [Blastococcus sp. DSM 46838]
MPTTYAVRTNAARTLAHVVADDAALCGTKRIGKTAVADDINAKAVRAIDGVCVDCLAALPAKKERKGRVSADAATYVSDAIAAVVGDVPGARRIRRARSSGATVASVYLPEGNVQGAKAEAGPWAIVCLTHKAVLPVRTRKEAAQGLPKPEAFCTKCAAAHATATA